MTTTQLTATPRDFTVLLPPGWYRISLDGRENARAKALAAMKTANLPEPQRQQVRERLAKLLKTTLREARHAGGIDVMISLAERDGIPLAASCLVSYVDQGTSPPLDALVAELGDGDVSVTTTPSGPAVRHRYLDQGMHKLDFHLPVPGRTGLLTFAFATPVEPLADAFMVLFEAIAASLRWRR